MQSRRTGRTQGRVVAAPTTTVKVSDRDELGVWVVGEGVPVVLIHGALIWSLLEPLARALAAKGDYQVVWYHRRGYNGKPTAPASVLDQARDVVKILDELEIDRAHVAGHSAGANYALALATLAQDRLLSAALLDFVLIGQVPSREMFTASLQPSLEKARTGDFEGAATTFLAALGATEELMEGALPGSWSAMLEDAPTWFQVELPASAGWTPEPAHVEAIEVPLAFLSANELPPFRETGELLQTWQPALTRLDITTDHHFFPITATEETAEVIDRWLKGRETAR